MGTTAQDDDPLLRLKYYESTGQTDEAENYRKYLIDTGQIGTNQIHRLAQRPGGLNRLKANIAERNAADIPSLGANIQGAAVAAAHELPGVERLQAGVRSVVQHEPYSQALGELRTSESEAPAIFTEPARAAAMLLPAGELAKAGMSAAKIGALASGANAALAADQESPLERALRTVVAAGTGAALGKGTEALGTVARAEETPTLGKIATDIDKARTAASRPAYKAFRDLPYSLDTEAAKPLKELMELPLIQSALKTVKGESPTLNKLPDLDSRVVDALYKKVGNKAFKMQGYESDEAREALKQAIEDAAKAVGGSYSMALSAFRGPSEELSAVKRGGQWLDRLTKKSPLGNKAEQKLVEDSPEAIGDEFARADPRLQDRMRQGAVSRLKELKKTAHIGGERFNIPTPMPSKALRKTMKILREHPDEFTRLLQLFGGEIGALGGSTTGATLQKGGILAPTPNE